MSWFMSGIKSGIQNLSQIANELQTDDDSSKFDNHDSDNNNNNNNNNTPIELKRSAISDELEKVLSKLRNNQSANLPKDQRRDLLQQLRGLAHVSKMSGWDVKSLSAAIPAVITSLQLDRADVDLTRDNVAILLSMICVGNSQDPTPLPPNSIQLYNAELVVGDIQNVTVFLGLLEESDFAIRFAATSLLRILATNKSKKLQEAVLVIPMGIARIIDLLRETRDPIRNEGLLLMRELPKDNADIQKIVAFEGAFEMLLHIIFQEGIDNDSIIVQDCLTLINNLLRASTHNQNYFRETNTIKQLPPLLDVNLSTTQFLGPSEDKIMQMLLSLETVNILVEGEKEGPSNQRALAKIGILARLMQLALLEKNVPPPVRAKALATLGGIILGCEENRLAFAKFTDSEGHTCDGLQATLTLLWSLGSNNKDPHHQERNAALHLLRCYLLHNDEIQNAIVTTFMPAPDSSPSSPSSPKAFGEQSIGSQLVQTIFAWDQEGPVPFQSFTSSLVVSYLLHGNAVSKELVLKTLLDLPSAVENPPTLMAKMMKSLALCAKIQPPTSKVLWFELGLLRILAELLYDFAKGTAKFVSESDNLQFITSLVTAPVFFQHEILCTHIQGLAAFVLIVCFFSTDNSSQKSDVKLRLTRIGIEQLQTKLQCLQNTTEYQSAKHRTPLEGVSIYTKEFTDLFDLVAQQCSTLGGKEELTSLTTNNNNNTNNNNTNNNNTNNSNDMKSPLSPQVVHANGPAETVAATPNPQQEELLKTYKNLLDRADQEKNELKKKMEQKEQALREAESKFQKLESNSVPKDQVKELKENLKTTSQKLENALQEAKSLQIAKEKIQKSLTSAEEQLKELTTEHEELLVVLAEIELENKGYKKQLGIESDDDDDDEEEDEA